jgi:alpha-tubulin suppressor-like RCC1 family protein
MSQARSVTATFEIHSLHFNQVATGWRHTCAVTTTNAAMCWGRNDTGQLGNDSQVDAHTPIPVTGLSAGVAQIDGGKYSSCALLSTGSIKCWGQNDYGTLGTGDNVSSLVPVPVVDITNATKVATGDHHTCAVLADSSARCWGYNSTAALGDGTSTNRFRPVTPIGLTTGVTDIAAGESSSCAVVSGGVKCWGSAFGTTTPADLTGLTSGVVAVSTMGNHWCARMSSGGAKCWGQNNFGQLGDGNFSSGFSLTPVDVVGVSNIVDLDAGGSHSCLAVLNGQVFCWGLNNVGQIGLGYSSAPVTPPQAVPGLSNVVDVAAGGEYGGPGHSCALTAGGSLYCWGLNISGEMGDGTTTDSAVPIHIG